MKTGTAPRWRQRCGCPTALIVPSAPPPRLLDRVRGAVRLRHLSCRTEKAYVGWIRRFILFHAKRHPIEMGPAEITRFLSALATERNVSASTQNQALAALLFLYRDVLDRDVPWLDELVRARRPTRLPVVLSRDEVGVVIGELQGVHRLMATLLYGAGLRLLECARLRVKDVDFGRSQITVRGGKGDGIDSPFSPQPRRPRSRGTCCACAICTRPISAPAPVGSSCPRRWRESIPMQAGNGCGSGSFRRLAVTFIVRPDSSAATTSMSPSSNVPCAGRPNAPRSPSA